MNHHPSRTTHTIFGLKPAKRICGVAALLRSARTTVHACVLAMLAPCICIHHASIRKRYNITPLPSLHDHDHEEEAQAYREQLKGERLYRRYLCPRTAENTLDEALDCYARAMEQAPESPTILCGMARIFLRQGDYSKAARLAHKSLDRLPQHPRMGSDLETQYEATYILAMSAYRHGDTDNAQSFCRRAVRAGGLRSARAHRLLFALHRERIADAAPWLEALGHLLAAGGHGLAGVLLSLFDRERFPFVLALLILPRLLLAWMLEGMDMTAPALAQYLDIHDCFPGLAMADRAISRLYRKEGRLEEAQMRLETTIYRHPDQLECYRQLAEILEEQEDYAGMADLYETLLRLNPGEAHLHCHLANARFYLGDCESALAHYESALQTATDVRWKAMIAQSIANIHCDFLRNFDAAIAYYQLALSLDGADMESQLQLGLMYFQKEDYCNAELIYRKALRRNPRNAQLYSNLGYLRWMAEDADDAIACYQKAIRLDPEYEIPVNNLGVIYLDMLGRIHEAIGLFQRAIALSPDYALAHYNLGRAHGFLGNRSEAAQCFRMAQEANQRSQEMDHDELSARICQLFDCLDPPGSEAPFGPHSWL